MRITLFVAADERRQFGDRHHGLPQVNGGITPRQPCPQHFQKRRVRQVIAGNVHLDHPRGQASPGRAGLRLSGGRAAKSSGT